MADTENPIVQTEPQVVAESSDAAAPEKLPLEPMEDILRRRVTTIKEGDNVLLKLPSEAIKAVVASKDG
jgi:tRNA (adenine-N(1)-)-methyltransferase non-catalytic subunit